MSAMPMTEPRRQLPPNAPVDEQPSEPLIGLDVEREHLVDSTPKGCCCSGISVPGPVAITKTNQEV